MFKSRRDFLKKSAQAGVLGVSSSLLSGCTTLMGFWSVEDRTDQVVIVGAGISGLSCAFSLKRAGQKYCLFEANQRIGGRILTQFDATPEGDAIELGGEFIEEHHSAIKDLAKYMSFPLKEIRGEVTKDFKLQGKKWTTVSSKPIYRIEGGNSLLIRRLKDRVGGVVPETNLKTGHELISIRIEGANYRLVFKTAHDGLKEIEARHVVLALPLSQLSRIDGLSLINPYLKDVFLQIQPIATTKLILPINQKLTVLKRKVALVQDGSNLFYPSLNADTTSSRGFYSTEIPISEVDQNLHVEKIRDQVTAFEKLTAQKINPNDLMIKSWGKESWIQMSRSYLVDSSADINIQSEIRSGLYLVGEHMSSKHMGTMNGAVETGQLAAERIVESVRKKQSEDSKVS